MSLVLTLLLDASARIKSVLRDEIGLPADAERRPLGKLLSNGSIVEPLLRKLRRKRLALDLEIELGEHRMKGTALLLVGEIVLTAIDQEPTRELLLERLLRDLDELYEQRQHDLALPSKGTNEDMFVQLMKMNNELAARQRDLAKRNQRQTDGLQGLTEKMMQQTDRQLELASRLTRQQQRFDEQQQRLLEASLAEQRVAERLHRCEQAVDALFELTEGVALLLDPAGGVLLASAGARGACELVEGCQATTLLDEGSLEDGARIKLRGERGLRWVSARRVSYPAEGCRLLLLR